VFKEKTGFEIHILHRWSSGVFCVAIQSIQ